MKKHKGTERYELKSKLFATLRPGAKYIGPIQTISKKGIDFHCAITGSEKPNPKRVDIASSSGKFFVKGIPCKIEKIEELDDAISSKLYHCLLVFTSVSPVIDQILEVLIERFARKIESPNYL